MDSVKRKAQDISHIHQSMRKKSSRVTCPGCNESFTKKHFERWHKARYLCNDEWTCTHDCLSSEDNDSSISDSNDEDSPSTFREQLRRHIQKHVTSYMAEEDVIESSDEEPKEIWEDILEDDMDADLNNSEDESSMDDAAPHSDRYHASLVFSMCVFVCTLQVTFGLPDIVVAEMLRFLKTFFEFLSEIHPIITPMAAVFPGTIYMLWKSLRVKRDAFRKSVVCKKCHYLYKPEDCFQTLEGNLVSKRCTYIEFPNHTQLARREACGEMLMKTVTLTNGKTKLYPYKTYCYKTIESTFKRLLKRRDFEDNCEKWRSRPASDDVLQDVYDGDVWKYFQSKETNNFLETPRNYCIMLNLDWFQPFKHVCYSVGVIYAVVLNIPRNERFKLENVALIGIIPEMDKEPPTNTFMEPLVNELMESWNNGFFTKTYKSPKQKVLFKIALMGTGCDIPATRKLCGFLGHTARLGCSKCLKEFPGSVGCKDYSGFDACEERKLEDHKKFVQKIKLAKTQTEKMKLESDFGVRHSCLLTLPYFDPIRMSIIDPMHNLYLGTAKHMIRVWQSAEVLTQEKFARVQEKCDAIITPTTVGRLPRKISSLFGGFTAEQFMLWTNLFSLLALPGIIEEKYILHWQYFVLASRLLCSSVINRTDLELFDKLIREFCKSFEILFGKDLVTPNMHLHMHLSKCVKDYGPVHGFWLFSFERYNGHLGSMPNKSVS